MNKILLFLDEKKNYEITMTIHRVDFWKKKLIKHNIILDFFKNVYIIKTCRFMQQLMEFEYSYWKKNYKINDCKIWVFYFNLVFVTIFEMSFWDEEFNNKKLLKNALNLKLQIYSISYDSETGPRPSRHKISPASYKKWASSSDHTKKILVLKKVMTVTWLFLI